MQDLRIRRGSWWAAALVALLGLPACSTQNVTLKAMVGNDLNPNYTGGNGILDVYAFFLKKEGAFAANDKLLADFLVDSVRAEKKPPSWLADDTIAIELMQIAPAEADAWPVVEKRVEVPVGATHVGLIAAFQSHADNDDDERWRLVVPVSGGTVAFRVAGKKLEPMAPPPPKPTTQPTQAQEQPKKKEAPRAGSTDR